MVQLHNCLSETIADDLYVNVSGDTMEGDLKFPVGTKVRLGNTSYFQISGNKVQLYVNDVLTNEWEQDAPSSPVTGNPVGLLLSLTYT